MIWHLVSRDIRLSKITKRKLNPEVFLCLGTYLFGVLAVNITWHKPAQCAHWNISEAAEQAIFPFGSHVRRYNTLTLSSLDKFPLTAGLTFTRPSQSRRLHAPIIEQLNEWAYRNRSYPALDSLLLGCCAAIGCFIVKDNYKDSIATQIRMG